MTFGKPDTYLDSRRLFYSSIIFFILSELMILISYQLEEKMGVLLPFPIMFMQILSVALTTFLILLSYPYIKVKINNFKSKNHPNIKK